MAARSFFSYAEDKAMWNFMIDQLQRGNPDAFSPKGYQLWQLAERKKITNRSSQSMQNRWRRFLLKDLHTTSMLTSAQIVLVEKALEIPRPEYLPPHSLHATPESGKRDVTPESVIISQFQTPSSQLISTPSPERTPVSKSNISSSPKRPKNSKSHISPSPKRSKVSKSQTIATPKSAKACGRERRELAQDHFDRIVGVINCYMASKEDLVKNASSPVKPVKQNIVDPIIDSQDVTLKFLPALRQYQIGTIDSVDVFSGDEMRHDFHPQDMILSQSSQGLIVLNKLTKSKMVPVKDLRTFRHLCKTVQQMAVETSTPFGIVLKMYASNVSLDALRESCANRRAMVFDEMCAEHPTQQLSPLQFAPSPSPPQKMFDGNKRPVLQ